MITTFKNIKISYLISYIVVVLFLCCVGFFSFHKNGNQIIYADGIYCGYECSVQETCRDIDENGEPSNCGCNGGEYYWQCNDPNVCSVDVSSCPGYGQPQYDSVGAFCGNCTPDCDNGQCGSCGCGFSGGYEYEYEYQYQYPTPFNYSLSNSGNSNAEKVSGGNAYTQNTIFKNLVNGVSELVSIAASGVPSGVSTSISNNPCSPNCNSVITFTVFSNAPVGTFPITVTGSPLSKTTNFNLIIDGAPITTTLISPGSSTALLGEGVVWQCNVSGGTPPFTYAWSGSGIPVSPAPSTNPYTIVYSTIGQKTATLTVTDDDGIQGVCNGSVYINFDPHFEEF